MKKVLSVLLATIMIFACMGVVMFAFAEEQAVVNTTCTCADHNASGSCHCCVYCPNLDKGYLTSCVKYNENGEASFCCSKCTGIWPCNCGCDCCNDHYADIDNGSGLPLLNEDQQQTFISGFHSVFARITAVFDRIFDAILKFLRVEEVFPDLMNN